MQELSPQTKWIAGCFGVVMGSIFACMGGYIELLALGIIPSDPADIHAPLWLIAIVGAMFVLIGLWIGLHVARSQGAISVVLFRWLEFFIIFGIMAIFSTTFLWIGFGPGEREFSGSGSIGPFVIETGGDEGIVDRLIFGGFGLIAALMTLRYAVKQAWSLFGGDSRDRHNEPE